MLSVIIILVDVILLHVVQSKAFKASLDQKLGVGVLVNT